MIPIDDRSLATGALPETLKRTAASWAVAAEIPDPVAAQLERSRRLFIGATATYDNLVMAMLAGFQGVELALRHALGTPHGDKRTLALLIHSAGDEGLISLDEHRWLEEFVLHFRNRLSHPPDAIALTPGIAAPVIGQVHAFVVRLFDDPRTSRDRASTD